MTENYKYIRVPVRTQRCGNQMVQHIFGDNVRFVSEQYYLYDQMTRADLWHPTLFPSDDTMHPNDVSPA